jgi:integrase
VNADYLKRNPLQLIKKVKDFKQVAHERRYKIKERMLERDEWQALQQSINELPEELSVDIDYKLKVQFLFSLLYLLGLRIHEVAKHTWGDFRQFNGQWCFWVLGKGDKLRDLQVNEQLLSMLKIYRLHLNKPPLPSSNEVEHLIVSKKTKKPLKLRQLFQWVKDTGRLAAQKFQSQPEKAKKLQHLSPHWLRHLLASHLDEAGSSGSMIQSILRHGSFSTTQNYLHTEEKRRYEEMQKIRMDLEPKLAIKKPDLMKTELKLSLKGGPLSEKLGLERFIAILDGHILVNMAWERKEVLSDLIERYQKIKVLREPLQISYVTYSVIEPESLENIKKSIVREAEIRLFDCQLQLTAIPVT